MVVVRQVLTGKTVVEHFERFLTIIDRFGWSNVILCFIGFGVYRMGVAAFGKDGYARDLCSHIKAEITEVKEDHKGFVIGALDTSKKTAEEIRQLNTGTENQTQFMLILCDVFENMVSGTEHEDEIVPHIIKARSILEK